MYDPNDTIVAISSAPGPAARGIVRLSGPHALPAAAKLFQPNDKTYHVTDSLPWTRMHGRCRLTKGITCSAEAYIFRAPRTYTTQHMAELHLPGSPPLLQMVLEQLLTENVRMAEPGEFTARAFFSNRIDLTEAEAVAALINARSDAQLRAAERLLDGALHTSCATLAADLSDTLALVEAAIDFAEGDLDFASQQELHEQVSTADRDLRILLHDSTTWQELNHLPRVAVLGRPNVGKSSLTNALTGLNRSIVAGIAGTTRDMLTAPLQLNHGECLLIDTAGLAETSDRPIPPAGQSSRSDIFDQSQHLAHRAAATCDLILWVFDVASDDPWSEQKLPRELESATNIIFVANKIDLRPNFQPKGLPAPTRIQLQSVPVSALTGQNLELLKARIERALHGDLLDCPATALALTVRQQQELYNAAESITRAAELLAESADLQPELVALELRTALDHLGNISGEIVPEDVLGKIFSRFCVGK